MFAAKYRCGVFNTQMLNACEHVMAQVCTDFGATLAKFNPAEDHVHLLAAYPPKVALSHLANSLKSVSSRRMRQDFAGRINKAATRGRFWSPSYLAGPCGGPPLSTVQDYITNQKRPDQATFPPCPEGQGFHPRSPMTLWTTVLLASALAFALKFLGYVVPHQVLDGVIVSRVTAMLPVALLSALVVVQTFTASGGGLTLDARAAGLAVAVTALLLRAPFLVVVILAAATTAVLRALGWG